MLFDWLPYALQFQSISQKAEGMAKEASYACDLQVRVWTHPDTRVQHLLHRVTGYKTKEQRQIDMNPSKPMGKKQSR